MVVANWFKSKSKAPAVMIHVQEDVQERQEAAPIQNAKVSPPDDAVSKIVDNAVSSSISVNELFIGSIEANQIADNLNEQVHSISASIEEMSATVNVINDNTGQALESTQATQQSAMDGHQASDRALETMGEIHSSVDSAMQKTAHLSESSKQIEGIITQIQVIAEQTNLLALNATIEAARAGEAGKGFAVVAGEVKSLANQTGKSAQEISDIIEGLVSEIREIVEVMNSMNESVTTGQQVAQDVKQKMSEIEANAQQVNSVMDVISSALKESNEAISEISRSTSSILGSSTKSSELSAANSNITKTAGEKIETLIAGLTSLSGNGSDTIIKLAKSDHIVWKRKLFQLVLGGETLSESELKDHTQCRLGNWYYSDTAREFSHMEAYKKLEDPHKRIHAVGRKVYNAHQEGAHDEALKYLTQMEEISQEVISLLNEIDESN